jgi:hypothetical protein
MQSLQRIPSAGTIADLVKIGRDLLTNAETVTVAAIVATSAINYLLKSEAEFLPADLGYIPGECNFNAQDQVLFGHARETVGARSCFCFSEQGGAAEPP